MGRLAMLRRAGRCWVKPIAASLAIVMATLACPATAQTSARQLKDGRAALLEEIRFQPFDRVELEREERCPAWLTLALHEADCRRLTVIYRGIYLSGMLIQHSAVTNRLAIYHVGHESTALPGDDLGKGDEPLESLSAKRVGVDATGLIRHLLNRHEDVLVLFMPGIGLVPRSKETEAIRRLDKTMEQHNAFALLDFPMDSAAAYFVAHVKGFLDRHGKQYRKVTMVGRSGGGWATTLAAAFEPRIECSISFFGTLPLRLRLPIKDDARNDLGDFEQYGLYLYKRLDYLDLYAQATWPSRRHTQVYNIKDDCCFSGEFKGSKVAGMFTARYPKVRGFRVDILPLRSNQDHGNLDESTWALVDERCPVK